MIKTTIKYLEIPIVLSLLLGILFIIYYPLFQQNHINEYVISGEADGFAYWAWREWMASGMIDSTLSEKPYIFNFLYYGILINNTKPESGNILDIILLSYPLRKLVGFPASYNIKVLLILLFNGFAGYFVASRLVRNRWIGFVCGTFIMLNPIVFFIIHKARLRDAILGFMILYLYYLFKAVGNFKFKYAVIAGVFLGLTCIFYWFYGMFCIWITMVLIFLVFLYLVFKRRKRLIAIFLKRIGVGIIVTSFICLPFVIWYTPIFRTADILTDVRLFMPFPVLKEIFADPPPFQSSSGYPIGTAKIILYDSLPAVFFPFSIPFIVLGILAFLHRAGRDKKRGAKSSGNSWKLLNWLKKGIEFKVLVDKLKCGVSLKNNAVFLILVVIFFYLFSFGPYLRTIPEVKSDGFVFLNGSPIRMPYYYFFQYVPGAGRLHHPVEGLTVVAIGLMMLSGMGAAVLWKWMRKIPLIRGLALFLLLVMVFLHTQVLENFLPFPVFPNLNILAVPQIYKDIGEEPRAGIIELPLDRSVDLRCFYKTYHRQKMLLFDPWNMILMPEEGIPYSRFKWSNENQFFLRDLPFVQTLEQFYRHETDALSLDGIGELKAQGYKYILLHERDFVRVEPAGNKFRILGREDYERFRQELERHFGKPAKRREFHSCLLSIPNFALRNDYPHFSFEISVYEIQ